MVHGCGDQQSPLPTSASSSAPQTGSGLVRQPRPSPQLRSHGPARQGTPLSLLTRNVKLQLLHRALKGLQAPGATQALQRAGTGLQNNRLLPCPIDLNPVHACPCDSNSARAKAPLPALSRCSFPSAHKGTPLAEGGRGAGTTRSRIAGGGIKGRWCMPRSDLVTQRRLGEAWDKLMSIVLLFLSESKSKSNYKIQW